MESHRELCSPIIDLRQYTLYPGTRDAFVELFDREFVETQEAAGMRIIGQFHDLGDPNRFVWMRGFPDMPSREKALTAFYMQGAAWKKHASAANSLMIDASDAMLLHPARADSAFALPPASLRPALSSPLPTSLVVATLYALRSDSAVAFLRVHDTSVTPVLLETGAAILGLFATHHSPNNFPRLPLREAENLFLSFTGFRDLNAYHYHLTSLGRHPTWGSKTYPALIQHLRGRPQVLRLSPTSRSQLR